MPDDAVGKGGLLTNDRVAAFVLALFALVVALESRRYPFGTVAEPGPAYLPFALAVALLVFSVTVMVNGGRAARFSPGAFGGGGKAFAILAGMAFATAALESLGYRVTVAILLVYLLGVVERKPPAVVVSIAAGFALGSFHLFAGLLKVPLPLGIGGF
jgi:hypothetical protein